MRTREQPEPFLQRSGHSLFCSSDSKGALSAVLEGARLHLYQSPSKLWKSQRFDGKTLANKGNSGLKHLQKQTLLHGWNTAATAAFHSSPTILFTFRAQQYLRSVLWIQLLADGYTFRSTQKKGKALLPFSSRPPWSMTLQHELQLFHLVQREAVDVTDGNRRCFVVTVPSGSAIALLPNTCIYSDTRATELHFGIHICLLRYQPQWGKLVKIGKSALTLHAWHPLHITYKSKYPGNKKINLAQC